MSPSEPRYQLPEGWTAPERIEDVIVADGITIYRAGLSAIAPSGEEVVGSAADSRGSAVARASFELLERVSCIEALAHRRPAYEHCDADGGVLGILPRADLFPESDEPDRYTYARSNGVALHVDWSTACLRAHWELAERDRILRAWYGEIAPERIAFDLAAAGHRGSESYDWQAYRFAGGGAFARGIEVVGVFGFPTREGAPFALGFAARPTMDQAAAAAALESVQMLAFLWGEPLPDEVAIAAQPSATQHLDALQVKGAHARVRRWLEGAHRQFYPGHQSASVARPLGFVDLTPPWLTGFRVVKAHCEDALPLVFGDAPRSAHLPAALRRHPIP